MMLDKLMLNCRQASELASQAMDEGLPLRKRLSLKFHLMMCRGCTNFTHQMSFLRAAASRLGHHDGMPHLSNEAKERIAKVLRDLQSSGKNDGQ